MNVNTVIPCKISIESKYEICHGLSKEGKQVFFYYTTKIQYLGSFPEFSYNCIILLYSCDKLKLGPGFWL